jgi:N-carbamoyl-L-amino-acid hydrolase
MTMQFSLDPINIATSHETLQGLYEHSPWIVQQALLARPFKSLAQFKYWLACTVATATPSAQLKLIKSYPELAGKAMVSQALTAESTDEHNSAGLTQCSAAEFEKIQLLNASYNAKFGFPFVLAVRGPRATGLSRQTVITTFERRLHHTADFERAECLRNIHRIAELRLNDKLGYTPTQGNSVWDWCKQLTTSTGTAAERVATVRRAGFDKADMDAAGRIVGRYQAATADAATLFIGKPANTEPAGAYDLSLVVSMACVQMLASQRCRLSFHLVAGENLNVIEDSNYAAPAQNLGQISIQASHTPTLRELNLPLGVTGPTSLAPVWQQHWQNAFEKLGLPWHFAPTPTAHISEPASAHFASTLLVRHADSCDSWACHNDDLQLAVEAVITWLKQLDQELRGQRSTPACITDTP